MTISYYKKLLFISRDIKSEDSHHKYNSYN